MDTVKRQQVVLVDPVTKETFKVLVNVQDVERVKTHPSYRQKMLNSIKKAKNVNSCLEPDKTDDLVELILTDGFHQVHTLKVPIEVRKQALSDIPYATKLLNGHLPALKSNSEVNQQSLCNGLTSEFETSSAALQEGTFAAEKKMYELTLKDQLTMETFTFIVDKKSFNRAKTDMVFATKLLDDYKASINKQKLNSLSTDMNKCGDDTAGTENSSDQLQNLIDTYENDDFDEDITKKNTGRYVWSNQETLLLIHLYTIQLTVKGK
ncbi:uncharacterized protein LOC107980846 [Nasonia vitripennis]|uniref:Uncharacterized protein n=1 Tax=Nasonia vitripennis TaxID=7425 RepID=A0A7M7IWS9_NASVI|nr:uncharacterized protein LOC107980846 [Nasonia vitripennis]